MKEILIQLLQDSKSSYTWTNRACWALFITLAGWSGSYAINQTEELVGAWWKDGKDFTRLIVFIILLSILARYHYKTLSSQNKEKKENLTLLKDNQLLADEIHTNFEIHTNLIKKFNAQCREDQKNFLLAIVGFLIIIALPL